MLIFIVGCGQARFEESFDDVGNWRVGGEPVFATGQITDGVYRLNVEQDVGIFWSTLDQSFANGTFAVDAKQVDGPIDAGFGMLFRVDDATDTFYKFGISADGFARVDRCISQCTGADAKVPLISNDWFRTPTIEQGLNKTNRLSVEANYANLIFYVNNQEIGRVSDIDTPLLDGDIGLYVETLGYGGVTMEFDNFVVDPLR